LITNTFIYFFFIFELKYLLQKIKYELGNNVASELRSTNSYNDPFAAIFPEQYLKK